MPVYPAEAVVLRKVDFGEADRILTLFTLERGKLPAIAKGVRKAKARMSGQLDVFAHGRWMLAEGRNMDVVTQFQRIGDKGGIYGDLPRSAAAAMVAEIADKVLEERHPQPDLFHLVTETLAHLGDPAIDPRMESSDFLTRVLVELGYAPELRACARCGGPLPEAGMAFSPISGGVVCAGCATLIESAFAIDTRAVKILRVLAAGDREMFFRLRLEDRDLAAVGAALEAQVEHHLDRRLKSIDFVRRVHGAPGDPDRRGGRR
jgi:DNA repair protein RecO (recombination protein O)